MKRIVIICTSLVAVIIISLGGYLIYSESKRLTFDEITNYKFSEYAYTDAKDMRYFEDVIQRCRNFTYEPYSGDLGNTERVTYRFYDIDDNLLFILTIVGNRNLIIVNVDGISTVYQGK